jgi:hypothetical protein
MTLKKSNAIYGQAALEYLILTILIVTMLLFFAQNQTYKSVNDTCDQFFNKSVDAITK